MKNYIAIALVIILSMCALYAMSGFFGYPTPPHKIKIDLSKSGNVYETMIKIREEDLYHFQFRFITKRYKEDKGIDRDKVMKFTGALHTDGTMIPVKLSIYKLSGNKKERIIDGIYNTSGINAAMAYALIRRIEVDRLDKGIYQIRLETLEDFEFLVGREAYLSIRQWKTK
ncbi:MAG: DUF5625 family protein [Campylobacteraceae bacterium]|jgi:hypothetical protein|nr:DUF5625 family protein [Campylobacteraceae bacterium]